MAFVLGIPPAVLQLVQTGLLERAFHDGLFPALMYRGEAEEEQWEGNTGVEIFQTRPGLLTPVTTPLVPGVDPLPQTVNYEQWVARLDRFGSTIDTHIPTSAVAQSDLFLRNIQQLGLQAGQSLNRIPRNAIFQSYLSGHTVSTAAAVAADVLIRVAALNGFTDVIIGSGQVRPVPVSPTTPLPITVVGIGTRNVIGTVPDDPTDPLGPGTIEISVAIGGAGIAARTAILSSARPLIIRSGGGNSVDAIAAADTFVLQDIINAVARLRRNNVQPHEDGHYHAHIDNDANAQVFADPVFQRLNQSLPDAARYQEAFIGTLAGSMCMLNNEAPDFLNSGARVSTGTSAFYSRDVAAETTNETGVNIGRILVTGRGALYERWLDEKLYVTEAGVTGRVGEFQVVNQGVEVKTERIRLILRAPQNRLQDVVAATWSYSGGFPVPSDITSGGPERFKRAVVLEHAMDSA